MSHDPDSEAPTDGAADGAAPKRYRCTSCGNLTRFDVTMTRRTRAFHHYSVGGELSVEDVRVLSEDVGDVQCRWCGPAGDVVPFDGAVPPHREG